MHNLLFIVQSRFAVLKCLALLKQNRAKVRRNYLPGSQTQYPLTLTDIQRVTQIKIIEITATNHLSISEHARDVICKCGQSLYAIKVLPSHGMWKDALKHIQRGGQR